MYLDLITLFVLFDRILELLFDKGQKRLSRPLTSVLSFGDLAVSEYLQGRVLCDVKPGGYAALCVAVHLAEQHFARFGELLGDQGGRFIPNWRKHVAEAAPVRIEVHQYQLICG